MADNIISKRIIKNSAFLYLRMLFTMWLNLWATRLILANLGIEDMGVYNVVGSIVSLFSVLSIGVTSAIQRFITYEAGKDDGHINVVFCSSLNIIFLLALFVAITLESLGLWFLCSSVNIPENCLHAATWVFHFSVLTSIITLIGIPYNALVIAHEKMDIFAYISIIQVVFNWGAAYYLSQISESHRLFVYALLIALASIITQGLYFGYCYKNYPESHYKRHVDKDMMKDIGVFTGISTTSNILQTITGQGFVFVINWTFGVAVNAVYAIALQLKNSVLSFGLNIFKAVAPQITKSYAEGNMDIHRKLIYSGSKAEVYMILFIMIPFLFKTEDIIRLWLGNVPEYSVIFTRCTIFLSLTYAAFEPIRTAVLATNKISKFLLIPDTVYLAALPITYIIGQLQGSPIFMILAIVLWDIAICLLRIYYATQVSCLTGKGILTKLALPITIVSALTIVIDKFIYIFFPNTILGLSLFILINSIILLVIIYFLGLNALERCTVNTLLRRAFTI